MTAPSTEHRLRAESAPGRIPGCLPDDLQPAPGAFRGAWGRLFFRGEG